MRPARISNPLTIIGMFATIAEVAIVYSLKELPIEVINIYIWFIVLFPTLLVILFFITLNLNPKVLYAPSDYKDEQHFVSMLLGDKINQFDKIDSKLKKQKQKALIQEEIDLQDIINTIKSDEINSIRNLIDISEITNREKEIVKLIVSGVNTSKGIAISMGMSMASVARILRSLKTNSLIGYDSENRVYLVHELIAKAICEF